MGQNPQQRLAKNLARLRRKDRRLAARVEAEGDDGFELVTGRSGATTAVVGGIQLASAYDPRREAQRVVGDVLAEKPDLIVSIGFGLGHHLEALRRETDVPIVAYEPCATRMRAALSARDSLTLFGDRRIDIASSPEALFQNIEARYVLGLRVQLYIHPPLMKLAPEAVREAVRQVARAKDYVDISIGTRVRDLSSWAGVTMQNAGFIMESPNARELFGKFRGLPAVVVSAGPSLDKQLETLKQYRNRVLVISIGQALGALRTAGIEPDLVHILESQNVAHQLSRVGTPENVNLVVTNDVAPSLFEAPVRSRFVVTPHADKVGRFINGMLGREETHFGGSTVAHGAVSLACALGASPICLIGQDLAYTDGRHYAKGSAYDDVKISFDEEGFSEIDSRGRAERLGVKRAYVPKRMRVVWVDGWHGEKVPTSPTYAGFIDGYRALGVACAMHGSEVVNCTEGGAHIEGLRHEAFAAALEEHATEPTHAQEIITGAYDAYEQPDAKTFAKGLGASRRVLQKLDRASGKGIKRCNETERELPRAHSPQRTIDLLRRIGKIEKEVRALLLEIPWIDAVVQPEINASTAELRRDGNLEATPEQAVKEARFLFDAAQKGVKRATRLLGFCSESIAGKRDFSRDRELQLQQQAKGDAETGGSAGRHAAG